MSATDVRDLLLQNNILRAAIEASKEESERWRARYGDSEDLLHKATGLLRWIVENQEEMFDLSRTALRDEWYANDSRAGPLREWDRKMEEARLLAGPSGAGVERGSKK